MATSTRTYAASPSRVGSGGLGMSRGRQLEAAVDSLSSWYFEYDEPKSGWHSERIHPLPEESSASEPHDDILPVSSTSIYEPPAAKPVHFLHSNHPPQHTNNQVDHDEVKPPALAPQKSDDSTSTPPPSTREYGSGRRSSGSTRGTTVASTGGSTSVSDLVVSGYTIRGTEKRVMYHIDVRGYESQLQTYTIRRSYTEFKHLHIQLTEILEARREHYYRTKAAAAAALSRLSLSDRDKIPFNVKDTRSSMDAPGHTVTTLRYSNSTRATNQDVEASASVPAEDPSETWFLTFTLPPLPNAGFLSYWRRHDRTHVQNRCEMFQEILRAAAMHPELRESFAMQSFLSIAPCAIRERGSSYVSLCEYSVPRLDLEEETRERKKLARERRRNSSAHPTTASEQ